MMRQIATFASVGCTFTITSAGQCGLKHDQYTSQDNQWKAWLSPQKDGRVRLALRQVHDRSQFDFTLTPTDGDLEIIDTADGDAVPARQYLHEARVKFSLAVSTDTHTLRFQKKGCDPNLPDELQLAGPG